MSDINIVLENRDDIHVAVEEKDINVEVPAGKDGRSLRPRGEWSASAAYAYLDLVSYQGSSYVALKAVPAGTLPTDTSYWMLSAEKGEPGGAVWGNISGDLSDQTDLQNALDAKADVIISSASGSIASFTDGSASPVTALSVAIEPVQDLHGYDNPWPAGGGKNKLSTADASYDNNGIKITNNGNGTYTVKGTATATVSYSVALSESYTFPDSNVYLHARNSATSSNFVILLMDSSNNQLVTCSLSSLNGVSSATNKNGQTATKLQFYISSGAVIDMTVSPMILDTNTADKFYPYSNVCPISGHTSATVTRTGENLNPNTGVNFTASTSARVFVKSGEVLTYSPKGGVTLQTSQALYLALFDAQTGGNNITSGAITSSQMNLNGAGTLYYSNVGITSITFTMLKSGWLGMGFNNNKPTNYDGFQLELGSSPTTYEAPQVQTVIIDLDGTRYGGVLNVLTGTMTATYGIIDMGSLSWRGDATREGLYYAMQTISDAPDKNYGITCSHYKTVESNANTILNGQISTLNSFGNKRPFIKDLSKKGISDADFKTAVSGVQLVYELATPLTVQLSPSQLSTLLGENYIWADTGDTSVTYRADTKRYIDGIASATAKVTRQMIADSATADGKAPKSLATGDLIIVGDELRKATANIGNGSAITASNSTTATLADVIKALQ